MDRSLDLIQGEQFGHKPIRRFPFFSGNFPSFLDWMATLCKCPKERKNSSANLDNVVSTVAKLISSPSIFFFYCRKRHFPPDVN